MEVVYNNAILRGVVGSTAHGTNIEGQDDRDEMGIFIEPPEYVCGLTPITHYIHRDRPEGERSQPGDLDLTFYSLRRFCELASKGNPTVILLLWLPSYILKTKIGEDLIAIRSSFVSKTSGNAFLGYLQAQRKRLTGELSKSVNRPELVAKYGYDTKFAMHALRLGLEGIEYLGDGKLTLPPKEPDLSMLRAVRTGKYSFAQTLNLIREAEGKLKDLVDKCSLWVDVTEVNKFLKQAHFDYWNHNNWGIYHEE